MPPEDTVRRWRVGVDQRITNSPDSDHARRKNSASSGRKGRLGPMRAAPFASMQQRDDASPHSGSA